MPIYLYRCAQHHETEREFPLGEGTQTTRCLECTRRAKRILSFPAIQFKGEGFSRAVQPPKNTHEKFYKDNGLVPKGDIVVDVDDYLKTSPANES